MKKHWLKILLLLVLVIFLTPYFFWPSQKVFAWYGSAGWNYRKTITIDHTKVTAETITFTASDTWTAPTGVSSVSVEAWGGGGGGGGLASNTDNQSSAGGAGGQYVKKTVSVTGGNSYTVTVGAAGAAGAAAGGNGGTGGVSWFSTNATVFALGGAGGQSFENGFQGAVSSTTGGIGDVVYAGGNGGAGGAWNGSGGGGEGGCTTGTGNAGGVGSAGVGGSAGAGCDGGDGGAGRTNASGLAGNAGTAPGGAGSGAVVGTSDTNRAGGAGAAGRVKITYVISNFPMYFNTTDANLKTVANGGGVGSATGIDILFTSSDGTTKLNHENINYNASTGAVTTWVQVPTISTSTDTVLYMYYGNASASDQSNKTATWNSDYAAVYHYNEGSGSTLNDSVASPANGTVTGASFGTGAGILQEGTLHFSGANNDRVQVTQTAKINSLPNFTWSTWFMVNNNSFSTSILAKQSYDVAKTLSLNAASVNGGESGTVSASTVDAVPNTAGTIASNNTWYLWTLTYNNTSGIATVYSNGVSKATATATGGVTSDSTYDFYIGNDSLQSFPLAGTTTETHIMNRDASVGWLLTEYNNQSATSTFYTIGSQESAPVTATGAGHKVVINNAKVIINGGKVVIP